MRNCVGMSSAQFRRLSLTSVTVLDLSGCPFVDNSLVTHISRSCMALSYLNLNRTSITDINQRSMLSSKPFQAPFLTSLHFDGRILTHFSIYAPNLTFLDMPGYNIRAGTLEDGVRIFTHLVQTPKPNLSESFRSFSVM